MRYISYVLFTCFVISSLCLLWVIASSLNKTYFITSLGFIAISIIALFLYSLAGVEKFEIQHCIVWMVTICILAEAAIIIVNEQL